MSAESTTTESPRSKRKRKPAKPRQDGWNGQEVYVDQPIPGFYKINQRIEGVGWVPIPARLWMVSGLRDEGGDLLEDEVFAAHVAGQPCHVDDFWPGKARHRLTEDEYNKLCEGNSRWQNLSTKPPQES